MKPITIRRVEPTTIRRGLKEKVKVAIGEGMRDAKNTAGCDVDRGVHEERRGQEWKRN
jgi:hypothetical protein